jgi:hypothetical protein
MLKSVAIHRAVLVLDLDVPMTNETAEAFKVWPDGICIRYFGHVTIVMFPQATDAAMGHVGRLSHLRRSPTLQWTNSSASCRT